MISICNEVEFEFCVIHVCQLLSISIKTLGLEYFMGMPGCICSGTLGDNYVVYGIILKTGWNQWKGRAHVVEGLSYVVYCYGWETSINLSSVVLTSLEPCPGLATWVGGGEGAKESKGGKNVIQMHLSMLNLRVHPFGVIWIKISNTRSLRSWWFCITGCPDPVQLVTSLLRRRSLGSSRNIPPPWMTCFWLTHWISLW